MTAIAHKPVCVVVGVGPGNGEALATAFCDAGYAVALLARQATYCAALAARLPDARAYVCDAADGAAVEGTFSRIVEEIGDVDTLVYNAGKGAWGAIDEIDEHDFEDAWRTGALGLFFTARRVIPAMKMRGAGNIVVISATASRRGGARAAALASAKMAQRALAESMARHLGPLGIHVSLLVLDGRVGGRDDSTRLRDRPGGTFIDPRAVAGAALQSTLQDRSAWSFESDLRPYDETW